MATTILGNDDASFCRPIIPVPHDWLTAGVQQQLNAAHPFAGCAEPGVPPRIFFRLKQRPSPPLVVSSSAVGAFGAGLIITWLQRPTGANASAYVQADTEAFTALASGRFIAVLVHRNRIVAAYEVYLAGPGAMAFAEEWNDVADKMRQQFSAGKPAFSEQWRLANEHEPMLRDSRASCWEMFADNNRREMLSPEHRLAIGWVERFRLMTTGIHSIIEKEMAKSITWTGSQPSAQVRDFVALVDAGNLSCDLLLKYITDKHRASHEAFLEILRLRDEDAGFGHQVPEIAFHYRLLLNLGIYLFGYSSTSTQEGTRIAWVSAHDGSIRYLTLRPREFPARFDPGDYWRRLITPLPFALGDLIGGDEIPAELGPESPYWRTFPTMEALAEVHASADALLEEALAAKQWSIPHGAVFELSVGPFVRFQAYETSRYVMFIAWTRRSEFVQMELLLDSRTLTSQWLSATGGHISDAHIIATMKLLLAALVRDFWVVEHREHVFRSKTGARARRSVARQGPVTVYLPRLKYAGTANLARCEAELGHAARRAHHVAAHLRRAPRASEHQLIIAARFGFHVPPGYTFVRPHERGEVEKDVVYRSRSALQSLYAAANEWSEKDEIPEWFTFERDMRRVLESFGLEIQHVIASQAGDHGIDVYATRNDGGEDARWLIHCKAYAPKEKIRPGIIRALIEARATHPRDTRGMLIATCAYTPASRALAAEHQIRVIDGFELSRLLAAL